MTKSDQKRHRGHLMLIKGKSYQEELPILNIYAPNTGAPSFIKQTFLKLKAHITPHTIIVETSTPYSPQYTNLGNTN